ncbi:MAG: Gamma-DL-glutamyl hydrolase [Firmicutes bacterium]|nr:Gamma-DL-glutamyl hydrolase [candidate division NPL-UPA2 bacterium]
MNLMKKIVATLVLVASVAVIPLPAMAATSNGARGARVVRLALSYLGRPYVFGATGPRAFDCSGFTRYVMARAVSIRLPRTAASQSRVGRRISRATLQQGDLVFFQNTYKRGVSHVGIALGNGRMVHAWTRGGVRINRLSERYFVAKYHSSRTMLR